jgi:hypothetical protein
VKSTNLGIDALIAAWLGLTVYLFLVAEPRPLGWAWIGPLGIAVAYFGTQWARRRRGRRATTPPEDATPDPR